VSAHPKEDGAVLLTTLLIMSFMASLVVTITGDVRYAVKRTVSVEDALQAAHYLDGAEAYALTYIQETLSQTDPTALNVLLQTPQDSVLPIDGGAITLSLTDGSNCLNPAGVTTDEAAQSRLTNLLTLLDVPNFEAQSIVFALADWQDADNNVSPGGAEDAHYMLGTPAYRSADSSITTVTEMRAVRGMTPEIFARLAPWMCVKGNADTALNINTFTESQAALLSATFGPGLTANVGTSVLADRPPGGWSSNQALLESGVLAAYNISEDALATLDTSPSALRVDITIAYRGTQRRARLYADLNGQLLSRERDEAVGAIIEDPIEEDTDER